MASYKIIFKPSVEKDLRNLPKPTIKRVLKRIEALEKGPVSRQSIRLTGAEHLYRIRVGDYRVVYGVDKELGQIVIHLYKAPSRSLPVSLVMWIGSNYPKFTHPR